MVPDGYEEALKYLETRKIPLGSWRAWLHSCQSVVDKHYKFACSWYSLVGLTIGMLKDQKSNKSYIQYAHSIKGASNSRFLFYFMALAHALTGASSEELIKTYPNFKISKRLRFLAPSSVLDIEPNKFKKLIQSIRPFSVLPPHFMHEEAECLALLLHGVYITSGDSQVLARLKTICKEHPSALTAEIYQSL